MLPRKCSQPACRNMLVTTDDPREIAGNDAVGVNEVAKPGVRQRQLVEEDAAR